MKSKKGKLLIALGLAILLISATVGTALAQEPNEEDTPPLSPLKKLLSRMVEILKSKGVTITEQQLLNAFAQAREELIQESLNNRLDRLVEQGRLTQEQADEIKEWWSQRPKCLGPRLGLFGPGLNLEGRFKEGLKWNKWRFPWAPRFHRPPIPPQQPVPTP